MVTETRVNMGAFFDQLYLFELTVCQIKNMNAHYEVGLWLY